MSLTSRAVVMLAMIVSASGCAPEPAPPDRARSILATCDAREIRVDYFGGQLTRKPNDQGLVEHDSRILQNLGEPPLYCGRADVDEEYRLLEVAFLGVYSDTVRVTKRGEEYRIDAATTLQRDSLFSSKQRVERQITTLEWTRIMKTIEPLGLWQIPPPPPPLPTPPPISPPIVLYHGSSYLVEGRKGYRYRAIQMGLKDLQKSERIGGVMFSIASSATATPPR